MLSKNQIKLIRSLELKKNRKREGLFVAEGPKVVNDLLKAGYKARAIYSTKEQITEEELQRNSFLQHPQQVLAVMEIPETATQPLSEADAALPTTKLCLALDGVQDPGNVGTILRIADWFGIDTVFCSQDTADVYAPKVVQATMGSLAHVRVFYTDLVALLKKADYPVYGTLLDGQDIYSEKLTTNGIIVMGNEGNGISADVSHYVTDRITIPNFNGSDPGADSLNVGVATAVVCSEFRRRFGF